MTTKETLTNEQQNHLSYLLNETRTLIRDKYCKGAREHGGCLLDYDSLQLNSFALEEAIDQLVYLFTQREKLIEEKRKMDQLVFLFTQRER